MHPPSAFGWYALLQAFALWSTVCMRLINSYCLIQAMQICGVVIKS